MGAMTYCLYLTQQDLTVAVFQMNYYELLQNKKVCLKDILCDKWMFCEEDKQIMPV